MPPRLPVRHTVELVHLGVLLPWAARASSTSAAASSAAAAHPSSAGPSGVDANDVVQPIAGPSTPLPPPPRPRPPQTSPIHHLLALPSPPPPGVVLQHLIDNPNDLTRSAGELLASYARRVNDLKAEKAVWDLMVRRKVVPVGMTRKARFAHERQAGFGLRTSQWQWGGAQPAGKGKAGMAEINANAKLKIKPTLSPDPATKVNRRAVRLWPPLESLPADREYTVAQLMGHLHFLLLLGKPPAFEDAWKLLPQAVDYQAVLGEHGRSEWKGKRRGGEWGESKKVDAGQPGLNLFNLYLAYPPCSPAELTAAYLARSSVPPNRQSLHLTILALLSTPIPPTLPDTPPTPPSPSRSRKHTPAPTPAPLPNPSPEEVASKVLSTIKVYLSRRVTPHLDTWRHIAEFALLYELEGLGRLAFEAWFAALEGLEREVTRAWGKEDKGRGKEEGEKAVKGEKAAEPTPTPTFTGPSEPPRFVFAKLGAKKWGWTPVVHAMAEKGWIEELKDVEGKEVRRDMKGRWGYVWKSGVGEEEVVAAESKGVKLDGGREVEIWAEEVMEKKQRVKQENGRENKLAGREGGKRRARYPLYRPTTTALAPLPSKRPPAIGGIGHLLPRPQPHEGREVEIRAEEVLEKERVKQEKGRERKLAGREGGKRRDRHGLNRSTTTTPAPLPSKRPPATVGGLGHLLPLPLPLPLPQPPHPPTHSHSCASSPSLTHSHSPPHPVPQSMSDLSRTSHDASHTTTHISNVGS